MDKSNERDKLCFGIALVNKIFYQFFNNQHSLQGYLNENFYQYASVLGAECW